MPVDRSYRSGSSPRSSPLRLLGHGVAVEALTKRKPPPAVGVDLVTPGLFVQRPALSGSRAEPHRRAALSRRGFRRRLSGTRGDKVRAGQTLLGIGRKHAVAAQITTAEAELRRPRADADSAPSNRSVK